MHPDRIGPYAVSRKIGSGGMGNVYLATDPVTGNQIAIKELPASLAREEGFVARFNREISALRLLNHPHIVRLYDNGSDGENYFYAMEFVDGETLGQRIHRERKLPWRDVVSLSQQISSALKAAHDAGIIHRDLKPSNLMLTKEGQIKLTDFGIARVFASQRLTSTGAVIGTAEYMSPEQAQGQRVTPRSDLYALGAVMYAMLTGRPPFLGTETTAVLQQHRYSQFDRPRRFVPEIPVWLDDLVCQLLEKDPAKRPADALVVNRKLQEIVKKVELQQSGDEPEHSTTPKVGGTTSDTPPEFGATLMRDLIRSEMTEASRRTPVEQLFNNTWVLVILFLMLLAGLVIGLTPQTETDEQLLARAQETLDRPPSSDWFTVRDRLLLPLLKKEPDRWQHEVEPLLEKITLYELDRNLLVRKAGRKRGQLPEPERLILQARLLQDRGDLQGAHDQLQAIRRLFLDEGDQASLLKFTDQLLLQVNGQLQQQAETAAEYLRERIASSRSRYSEHPDQALSTLEAAITLYEHVRAPAVASLVAEARSMVAEWRVAQPPPAETESPVGPDSTDQPAAANEPAN